MRARRGEAEGSSSRLAARGHLFAPFQTAFLFAQLPNTPRLPKSAPCLNPELQLCLKQQQKNHDPKHLKWLASMSVRQVSQNFLIPHFQSSKWRGTFVRMDLRDAPPFRRSDWPPCITSLSISYLNNRRLNQSRASSPGPYPVCVSRGLYAVF